MDSTSDDRTNNNTVRHQYRVLTDNEKELINSIKDIGIAFIDLVRVTPPTRESSLAVTKIEEAVMWAVKGVTK